jgi:hypothetical protein
MSPAHQKAQVNYHAMAEQIAASGGKVFLFASPGVEAMPVTIVANVAMLLAWEKGRCLLIDLDMQRDAVGKAFEMGERVEDRPKAYRTSVENLFVWPARNFGQADWIKAYAVVGKARANADYVLVNAPGLARHEECFRLLHAADGAFVFGEDDSGEIMKLLQAARCAVMGK